MPQYLSSDATTGSMQSRTGLWPAWIAVACSLGLTLLAWRYTEQDLERQRRRDFDAEVSEIRGELKGRLTGYSQTLRVAAGLFGASAEVTRKDWRDFVAALRLERDYPAIQALAFARAVSAAELSALVREMRRSGVADFAVHPPGQRERYVVNVFSEPHAGYGSKMLGHDMWQDSEWREALQRARDAGEPMITGKVTLKIDEQNNPVPAFIMYLPVASKSRGEPYGYVFSPLRMPALMEDILGRSRGAIALDIHDGTDRGSESLFFRSHARDSLVPAKLVHSETLTVGGRPWTLSFSSRPELEARADAVP